MNAAHDYVVIADNQIVASSNDHSAAQEQARLWSNGRYDTAKVTYLPNNTVQGIWHRGVRVN